MDKICPNLMLHIKDDKQPNYRLLVVLLYIIINIFCNILIMGLSYFVLFCNIFAEAHQNGCDFGAGGVAAGVQSAVCVAVD